MSYLLLTKRKSPNSPLVVSRKTWEGIPRAVKYWEVVAEYETYEEADAMVTLITGGVATGRGDAMTEGLHVLLRFEGLGQTPYNIVTIDHWNICTQGTNERNRSSSWQEVARGTYKEMGALARLMPDPKTFNFD